MQRLNTKTRNYLILCKDFLIEQKPIKLVAKNISYRSQNRIQFYEKSWFELHE